MLWVRLACARVTGPMGAPWARTRRRAEVATLTSASDSSLLLSSLLLSSLLLSSPLLSLSLLSLSLLLSESSLLPEMLTHTVPCSDPSSLKSMSEPVSDPLSNTGAA